MKNEILEFRIKEKIKELKRLCNMYMNYLLKDENDKFAKEMYFKYNSEKRLLEEILEGE